MCDLIVPQTARTVKAYLRGIPQKRCPLIHFPANSSRLAASVTARTPPVFGPPRRVHTIFQSSHRPHTRFPVNCRQFSCHSEYKSQSCAPPAVPAAKDILGTVWTNVTGETPAPQRSLPRIVQVIPARCLTLPWGQPPTVRTIILAPAEPSTCSPSLGVRPQLRLTCPGLAGR